MDVMVEIAAIESDEADHLSAILGVPRAWSLVVNLWKWGLQTDRRKGLFKVTNQRIAKACDWDGDPDKLVDALCETGWLRRQKDGSFYMRGWVKKNGRFFEQRDRARDRARAYRARQRGESPDPDDSENVTPNVTRTSRVTYDERERGVQVDRSRSHSRSHNPKNIDNAREDAPDRPTDGGAAPGPPPRKRGASPPAGWSDAHEAGFAAMHAAYREHRPRARLPGDNASGAKLRRAYLERRTEGYSADDLTDAARGLFRDSWRKDKPAAQRIELALRVDNVAQLIEAARGEAPRTQLERMQGSTDWTGKGPTRYRHIDPWSGEAGPWITNPKALGASDADAGDSDDPDADNAPDADAADESTAL